jgi:aspartyl-tRNA(Asn)/glutamyl-tRNA(Gln) amidotransferase subunit C
MALSEDQVRHVAVLARLGLTDEEVAQLTGELSGILEHIEKIGELDLADVEPMAHAVDVTNVMRPDENRPGLSQEQALANAPEADQGAFVIPRIVGVDDGS